MGHDITAYKNGVDVNAVYDEVMSRKDKEWIVNYDEYCQRTQVAYNHRSAGNALNQVLYLALGVMDEAYAGCSGNGSELDITLDQLRSGLKVLETKSFAGMTRDRNLVDDVATMIAGHEIPKAAHRNDVSSEVEFIQKCIDYLESNSQTSLVVRFG